MPQQETAPLSSRVRPGSEAAPWVCKEIEALERLVADLQQRLDELEPLASEIAKLRTKKIAKDSLPGFDAFWDAWPAGPRKVNKRNCLTRWVRGSLERHAEEIVNHVEACKRSRDWTKDGGAFIPAPLVYLNQERFLAPAPPPATPNGKPGSLGSIKYITEGVDHDGHFA